MLRCSAYLTNRETQITNTEIPVQIHWGSYEKQISVAEDIQKLNSFCFADGDIKWCSFKGKQYGGSLSI